VTLVAVTREEVSGESLPAMLAQEKGDLLDESQCRNENWGGGGRRGFQHMESNGKYSGITVCFLITE